MKAPIYLDYNATTPVDKRVLDVMLPYFTEKFGNASSKTHAFGWLADDAVKSARRQVASLIHCLDQEIVFTSGATEAINLAIKGVFENYQTKGKHIITFQTEHKAVLDTCAELEKRGAELSYLKVNGNGLPDLEELKRALRPDTILVTAMYANNETGVILPIREIAALAHANGSFLFCDATQAVGKIPVDVEAEGIDLMCLSAHKFYGPKGVGALYVRRKNPRVTLPAQMHGGGHERALRSGTLNVPGIVGLGKACELAQEEMKATEQRILNLKHQFEKELSAQHKLIINGQNAPRLFNTSNIVFQGIRSTQLISKIPQLAVAMGSACSSAVAEPSHVLMAMGLSDEEAYGALRFSFGKETTENEINQAIMALNTALKIT